MGDIYRFTAIQSPFPLILWIIKSVTMSDYGGSSSPLRHPSEALSISLREDQ